MDTPHIVKHVAEFEGIRLILKFVFAGFSHGISRFYPLLRGRKPARSRETTRSPASFQPDTLIILHFLRGVSSFFFRTI